MREIFYKAKSTEDGRWVYGIPRQSALGNWFMFEGDEDIPVNPDTICQYSGMFAKGADDIYEGDIMHFKDRDGYDHFRPVVFWNGCFCLYHKELECRTPLMNHDIGRWNVAGNIHDHEQKT